MSTILILLLFAAMVLFFIQCVTELNLQMDAGYVFGFSIFFDLIGHFYKLYVPGNSLFLLLAVPVLPVLYCLFQRPTDSWDIVKDQGIWLWFLFFGYSIVSLSWAVNDSSGLVKEQILFIHGVIPGVYTYIVYKKYGKFSWTVVALFGLAYAIAHLALGGYTAEYPGRLTLPGGNPIFDARMSLIAVAVSLWGRNIPLFVRLVTIGVAMTSAIYTQSRGPLVAFVIANLIGLLIIGVNKYRKGELKAYYSYFQLAFVAIIVSGIAASFFTTQITDWIGGSRFAVLVDKGQLEGDDNFTGRLDLQLKALGKLEQYPYFGTGLGGNTPTVARDFPHNIVLEIGSELGFVGLFLWGLALTVSMWAVKRNTILVVLLLQTLGSALVSGDFGFNYEYILVAFVSLAFLPKREARGAGNNEKAAVPNYRA
ncbi:O-antigen ligase family protein [Paenibacillus glycinis]|nr:O-antigen ligase family protein [Paenibacillus glycinis]